MTKITDDKKVQNKDFLDFQKRAQRERLRMDRILLYREALQQKISEIDSMPNEERYFLFFDTETTGLTKSDGVVQLSWILTDGEDKELMRANQITNPGFEVDDNSPATAIHHITQERINNEGVSVYEAIGELQAVVQHFKPLLVAHNITFDYRMLHHHAYEIGFAWEFMKEIRGRICTMLASTEFCQIYDYIGLKWPSLTELHQKLFGTGFDDAHNAMADTEACRKCFWKLKELKVIC